MELRKNTVIENVDIIDLNVKNKGIAKIDSRVIFVDDAVTGDKVDIEINKKKKGFFLARVKKFRKYSDDRVGQECEHFGICGGCKTRHIHYDAQLRLKEKMVRDNFERIGGFRNITVAPVLPAPKTDFYRNKLEYTFSNQRWLTREEIDSGSEQINRNGIGFHLPGKFNRIIDISKCWLQGGLSNDIRNWVRNYALENDLDFFDPHEQQGLLRNLIIRTTGSEQLMVVIVFGQPDKNLIEKLLSALKEKFPDITSLYYMVNEKKNDSVNDLLPVFYSGKPFIGENLEDIRLNIGPKSFYQTNSDQAVNLYGVVKDFLDPQPGKIVYDLYCGVGSIGLYLAKHLDKVVGIETVEESVDQANINKSNNGISNASFHTGQVEKILTEEFIQQNGKPDTVILDPPRAGLHPQVIDTLLEIKPEKIIYVSCNPATQARDAQLLAAAYLIEKMQPVDMFPHTFHIENVLLMKRMV